MTCPNVTRRKDGEDVEPEAWVGFAEGGGGGRRSRKDEKNDADERTSARQQRYRTDLPRRKIICRRLPPIAAVRPDGRRTDGRIDEAHGTDDGGGGGGGMAGYCDSASG